MDTHGASLPLSEEAVLQDWRNFPLKRLKIFSDRCLGNLSAQEFAGLCNAPLLSRIRDNWDQADDGIRALYNAVMQRITYEREQQMLESGTGQRMAPDAKLPLSPAPDPLARADQSPAAESYARANGVVERQAVEQIALERISSDQEGEKTDGTAEMSSPALAEPDRRLVIFQHICEEIRKATTLPEALSVKAQTEQLKLQALLLQDKEAQLRYAMARLAAIQRVGEIIADLEKQPVIHDDSGRFSVPKPAGQTDLSSVENGSEVKKSKLEILKENRISLSTANRYERLAGPPEPKIREAVHRASEQYFSQQLKNERMPKAGELLEVVETISGIQPKSKKDPEVSRYFVALLKDFEKAPANYNAQQFAQDQKLLALYQKVGEKFRSFFDAFEVESLSNSLRTPDPSGWNRGRKRK